jgi:hypothetical protein
MAAPRPEHAHATDRPATATLPPRPAHTTTGWRQDRRPVVSKRPLHSLAAAKMSPHIHIGPEPVLAAHARSPPAAGSRCPAGADSAPHSEPNLYFSGATCDVPRESVGITRIQPTLKSCRVDTIDVDTVQAVECWKCSHGVMTAREIGRCLP